MPQVQERARGTNRIGVRETRRIIGEYRLTADDLLNARKFEDVIARGSYPFDLHNPLGKGTILKRLAVTGRCHILRRFPIQ